MPEENADLVMLLGAFIGTLLSYIGLLRARLRRTRRHLDALSRDVIRHHIRS